MMTISLSRKKFPAIAPALEHFCCGIIALVGRECQWRGARFGPACREHDYGAFAGHMACLHRIFTASAKRCIVLGGSWLRVSLRTEGTRQASRDVCAGACRFCA